MGLDPYVLGALVACVVVFLAFAAVHVWWPEAARGGDE